MYRHNKKAWMTGDLFKEYVKWLNKKMRLLSRKIVLVVDNCPAHIDMPAQSNVEVVFLPPNVTSVVQPMDAGIIRTLKVCMHYACRAIVHV